MNERTIFMTAVEIDDPQERAVFIDEACGRDVELRLGVKRLLQAHFAAADFLNSQAVAVTEVPMSVAPGIMIGPYKLLQQIGEGGMGVVYMAEQTTPVERRVALKIIKPGMDTRQVIARFEAERQALAMMDHPNIARVLDAGTTGEPDGVSPRREIPSVPSDKAAVKDSPLAPRGGEGPGVRGDARPYFVMELVKGVPIVEYCDAHRLTPRERLELFVPVCLAVQHAHQKGVIHRDLKPSNVMVAPYDGRPVPKIIDFGVAKATGQKLTERTLFTQFGQVVGTLEYMSPEQAELNQLDIDTRSDIYTLGVLLYELLTGTTPLDRKQINESSFLEVLRSIREQEPPRPSTRLSASLDLPLIAGNRGVEPKRLCGQIQGELDWIVMKCLEKDRNRRYQTANSLADDLKRFLGNEPIEACPPSSVYRLRKFIRRNRGPVLAAALVLAALVAGIIGTTREAVRANLEADRANLAEQEAEGNLRQARQAVNRYFTRVSESTLLEDPSLEPLRRELLQDALQYYQNFAEQNADNPELQAELAGAWMRISILSVALGGEADSLTPLQHALDILEDLIQHNPDAADLWIQHAAGLYRVAADHFYARRPQEALETYERGRTLILELLRQRPGNPALRADLAALHMGLGTMHGYFDQTQEAADAKQTACDLWGQLLQENPEEAHYQAAQATQLADLSVYLDELGKTADADDASERSLELARDLVHRDPTIAAHRQLLGWACLRAAWRMDSLRPEEAEPLYRQSQSEYDRLARDYPTVPRYRKKSFEVQCSLGNLYWNSGRSAEAEAVYREVLSMGDSLAPNDPSSQSRLATFLATCPDRQFRDAERAVAAAQSAVSRVPFEPDYWWTLGVAHYRAGHWDDAIEALHKSADLYEAMDGWITVFLALAHWQRGEQDEARNWYEEALQWIEEHQPVGPELLRYLAEAEELMTQPTTEGGRTSAESAGRVVQEGITPGP